MKKLPLLLSLLLNLVIVVRMITLMPEFVRSANRRDWGAFRYFTIDSNLYCALTALVLAVCECFALAGRPVPRWALALKLTGTSAVALTLMTVLCFLGPTQGFKGMFDGGNRFMHLVGPLIAIVSLVLLEGGARLTAIDALLATLPAILYGLLYMVRVIFRHTWKDFYGFNRGGKWPVSMVCMFLAAAALSFLLTAAHNALHA